MSHHIKGQSRTQTTLFPEAIDDFVTEDNPIRVIDLCVDQLDLLDLGFEAVNAKLTGRPGYHPATMLKLYIRLLKSYSIIPPVRKGKSA
ncbi:MAG: transposase [Shewanella psychromarinicola]|jgi:transposase